MNAQPLYPRVKPSRGKHPDPHGMMLADLRIAQAHSEKEFKRAALYHFMYPQQAEALLRGLMLKPKKFCSRIDREIARRVKPSHAPEPLLPERKHDHGRILPQKATAA